MRKVSRKAYVQALSSGDITDDLSDPISPLFWHSFISINKTDNTLKRYKTETIIEHESKVTSTLIEDYSTRLIQWHQYRWPWVTLKVISAASASTQCVGGSQRVSGSLTITALYKFTYFLTYLLTYSPWAIYVPNLRCAASRVSQVWW